MRRLPEAETEIAIPFHHVDVMEVAWHGRYVEYLEIARGVLLDKISYNYGAMRDSGFAWPVTELKLRYVRPAAFGQRVRVRATLVEYELRLKIKYVVEDAATGATLTKGHTVQVPVDLETKEMVLGAPRALLDRLEAYTCG